MPEAHTGSEEVIQASFKDTLNYFNTFRTFFVSRITVEKTYQEHDFIQNALLKSQSKSTHQMTIKNYFN